jgi:hypothetical protein
MLMVILLCFSLKVADVSLSESGHLVPWWLTSHTIHNSAVSWWRRINPSYVHATFKYHFGD